MHRQFDDDINMLKQERGYPLPLRPDHKADFAFIVGFTIVDGFGTEFRPKDPKALFFQSLHRLGQVDDLFGVDRVDRAC